MKPSKSDRQPPPDVFLLIFAVLGLFLMVNLCWWVCFGGHPRDPQTHHQQESLPKNQTPEDDMPFIQGMDPLMQIVPILQ